MGVRRVGSSKRRTDEDAFAAGASLDPMIIGSSDSQRAEPLEGGR